MKKTMLLVLLCVVVISVFCIPSRAADDTTLVDVMEKQVDDADLEILSNESLYTEKNAPIIQKINFSRATILVNYDDSRSLMYLGEMSLQEVMEECRKVYYVLLDGRCYAICVTKKNGTYSCSIWANEYSDEQKWPRLERKKHLQAVLESTSASIELYGKQREVMEVYAFTQSTWNMHTLVYVTTEGTFVRFYTGKYAEDGSTALYMDMPMEEYRAWVAAFRDYQEEREQPAYREYVDWEVRTFGELVYQYDAPEDYFQHMTQINEKYACRVSMIVGAVAAPMIVAAVFLLWRRCKNRKKYGG